MTTLPLQAPAGGSTPKLYTDKPVAGFYKRRLVKGGPWVGVELKLAPSADPSDPSNEMDRSPRWQALVCGVEADPYETWISCCSHPISKDEYDNMTVKSDPFTKINLRDEPTIF